MEVETIDNSFNNISNRKMSHNWRITLNETIFILREEILKHVYGLIQIIGQVENNGYSSARAGYARRGEAFLYVCVL